MTATTENSRSTSTARPRVEVQAPEVEGSELVLTPEALTFLGELHRRFAPRRAELLEARRSRREAVHNGRNLGFLPGTAEIRRDPSWRVAAPAPGLERRRVEITGPTDRKMTINALNSGADVWMADFEDANTPHWANIVGGQANLYKAIRRDIDFTGPGGKEYKLAERTATLVVRTRGWHLAERHVLVEGETTSGSLTDFGLFFFHNAAELIARGAGPYFYLPKMESHLEARLWNDVFNYAEEYIGIPRGTIRATCLIETIPAAFEMEEILYELREHSSGLNAGRWDYIFSLIKNYRNRGEAFVLPDRKDVTMTVPFMRAYTELLVSTCHKRGAHAIGGMSAFIPTKDPAENERIFERVRVDKQREASDGFDGSWVAHPGLIPTVSAVFQEELGDAPHQLGRTRDDVHVTAADLLDVAATPGMVTEAGLRTNIAVGLRYLEAWLGGSGAVAIFGLMEDAATAEISRSQIWQWLRYETPLDDGRRITRGVVEQIEQEEYERYAAEIGDDPERLTRLERARSLFEDAACDMAHFPTFLTIPAYREYIV